MNNPPTKALLALALLLGAGLAQAQTAQSKGKASLPYAAASAPLAIRDKAHDAAELKAIEAYYAAAGEAESANFENIRGQISADLDHFVLDATTLSEDDNTANMRYTIVVRVELNVAALRNAMKGTTAVGTVARSEKSGLAFVFVSRQLDSQRNFDARVLKRVDANVDASTSSAVSKKGTEGEKIARGQVSTNASVDATAHAKAQASATVETGGSTTTRASETTWKIYPSAGLNQVFAQVFSTAGFRVQEAAFIEEVANGQFHVAAIEDDYRSGNDLKSATLISISRGMRAAKVPYVALGTLDLGPTTTDPQTGLLRVSVSASARVFDVTAPIPETLVSVGPLTYSGQGDTEQVARNNALTQAAKAAAQELASQMTSKGLH